MKHSNDTSKYRLFEHIHDVDISEQDILDYDPEVLDKLLIDHTMSAKLRRETKDATRVVNIFWATSDYDGAITDESGKVIEQGYRYDDEILPASITGRNARIVRPRVLKEKQAQIDRTKDKAEVFTPSWVCNAQNNLIDEAWFGRRDVFNHEITREDGTHTWEPTLEPIAFPETGSKSWKKYISDNRLEITCGEAPYLVSRYDTTTGEPIPIGRRIGLLDRKLRVVNEHVEDDDFASWYRLAEKALKHTYGYEWQGDFYSLTRDVDQGKKILVFFVSMQYLRLSQFVGGKEKHFDPLKKAIMEYDWDFVMADEAHEGIEAEAGVRVMAKLKKANTRILSLSGTPFNLLDKYDESEIYTWDYVMEQRAKLDWDEHHFGDPNPYADLPRMQILTFTLDKMLRDQAIKNKEDFRFHEFFRVWTEDDKARLQTLIDGETNVLKRAELQAQLDEVHVDRFVHEAAIKRFLDKLVEQSDTSLYPFSTDEFRDHFRFTKDTFNILKDCFDLSIFTGAAKRIRQMVKEADSLNTEDRIAKIATIFSYFHNPDKETVLTPWRVVNMQLSDTLGGWCFFNEEFDAPNTEENQYGEPEQKPRFVDRGEVTRDVFSDYNARILEINSKTGLYPLYMAYSVFKQVKEPVYRRIHLTGERGQSKDTEQYYHQAGDDLEIWKDVLQDNIFVVCRTPMAVSITKRTLAGFRSDVRKHMNIRCYEHEVEVNDLIAANIIKRTDEAVTQEGKVYRFNGKTALPCGLIDVLRAKPSLFTDEVVRGHDYWHVYAQIPTDKEKEDLNNMKFSAIVGNPPYQIMDGGNKNSATPVYNLFVDVAKNLKPTYISMIMPSRWCVSGRGLDEFRKNMFADNHLENLFDYPDGSVVFPGIRIGGGVCYFLWNIRHNSNLLNVSNIQAGRHMSTEERPALEFGLDFLIRDNYVRNIVRKVNLLNEPKMSTHALTQKPFGFRTNYTDFTLMGEVKLYNKKDKSGIGYVSRESVSKCPNRFKKLSNIILGPTPFCPPGTGEARRGCTAHAR